MVLRVCDATDLALVGLTTHCIIFRANKNPAVVLRGGTAVCIRAACAWTGYSHFAYEENYTPHNNDS